MAQLELDVVLFDGETVEDVAAILTIGRDVRWELGPAHNCWPTLIFTGPDEVLKSIRRRYNNLGKNTGKLTGKPPVKRGERRV